MPFLLGVTIALAGGLVGAVVTYFSFLSTGQAAIQLWKQAEDALHYTAAIQAAYVDAADPQNVK
jgi:hypothetical protein